MSIDSRTALIQEARALHAKRKLKAAQAVLDEFVSEHPDDREAKLLLATLLLERRQTERALELADALLDDESETGQVLAIRGEALSRLRRWDEAISAFVAALDQGQAGPDIYLRLAVARANADDLDGAITALEAGLTEYPEAAELQKKRLRLRKARGDDLEDEDAPKERSELDRIREISAIAELRRLLEDPSQSQNPHLLDELSRKLSELGDHADALEAARSATELAPANRALRLRLAQTLVNSGETREAIDVVEDSLEIDPSDKGLHDLYVSIRRRQGQLAAARDFYALLAERHPENRKLPTYRKRLDRELAQ